MPDPSRRFATKENLKEIATAMGDKYSKVTIDTDLSLTSTNSVENRVVAKSLNGLLARIGALPTALSDWSGLSSAIAAGNGPMVLPIGSQVKTEWTVTNGSTRYDAYWNAVHHTTAETEGGDTVSVAYLQMDRCLPFDTQFSPYQAFLCAVDPIPAGTYNVTMGFSWGSKVVSGKTYQFTLANALPAGGQLAGFYGAPDQSPSSWRVYAYASASTKTATETCVVTEGSGGTSLGTFTAAGVSVPASGTPDVTELNGLRFYGLNSLHRVAYGNNRWLHSALRQYLNSSGNDWWVPATVFDRPPAYSAHKGFLSGLDPDFVAQMVPTKVTTALNYVSDGGTSGSPQYDVTYDKVFLPSGREHYLADTAGYGGGKGAEGEPWDYWRRISGAAAPLSWSTWGNYSTYHPEYTQYDLAIPNAARGVFMRSARRGSAGSVTCVGAAGNCSNYYACGGLRAAPACAIGQSV